MIKIVNYNFFYVGTCAFCSVCGLRSHEGVGLLVFVKKKLLRGYSVVEFVESKNKKTKIIRSRQWARARDGRALSSPSSSSPVIKPVPDFSRGSFAPDSAPNSDKTDDEYGSPTNAVVSEEDDDNNNEKETVNDRPVRVRAKKIVCYGRGSSVPPAGISANDNKSYPRSWSNPRDQ